MYSWLCNILVLNVFYELVVEGNSEVTINFFNIRLLHGTAVENFFSSSCEYQTSRNGGDNYHHHMHAEVTEVHSIDLNQVCHVLLLVGKC